jgi:N-carbamoyl-L-amino-acid hydrolase
MRWWQRRAGGRCCHLRAPPGLRYTLEETMRAAPRPARPQWQAALGTRRRALGVPLHRMPSGAGHDAMKLHEVMPQAMLFVRGQNAGISHNPLESTTSDDMQLAVDAFSHLLDQLATEYLKPLKATPMNTLRTTRRLDRRPL